MNYNDDFSEIVITSYDDSDSIVISPPARPRRIANMARIMTKRDRHGPN
jgi:hypothetical protein